MATELQQELTYADTVKAIGWLSAELAGRADAWNGNAPEWASHSGGWGNLVGSRIGGSPQAVTPSYTDDPVLVERVARALHKAYYAAGAEPTMADFREAARAALDQEDAALSGRVAQMPCNDPKVETAVRLSGSERVPDRTGGRGTGSPPRPESAESSEPCPATGGQHVLARDGSYCLPRGRGSSMLGLPRSECGLLMPGLLSTRALSQERHEREGIETDE